MSNLEYHVPRTVGEALQLMAKYGADAKVIAGGTDLIPKMKAGITHFSHLISLKVIEELKYSGFDAEGNLHIGANTTLRDLEAMPGVKETFPALWEGMHSMANTQIRNRGMPAIANAVRDAIGAELFQLPFTRERVLKAIHQAEESQSCTERG